MEAISIITLIVAAVGAAANIGLFIVAWRGLSAWRQQLEGGSQHQAAVRLLRAVYELELTVAAMRVPWSTSGEGGGQRGRAGITEVVRGRLPALRDATAKLRAELTEARVFWGDVARERIRPLFEQVAELEAAAATWATLPEEGERAFADEMFSLLFERRPAPDEYNKRLKANVAAIRNYLQPYIAQEGGRPQQRLVETDEVRALEAGTGSKEIPAKGAD